jgi:hypothetical protein
MLHALLISVSFIIISLLILTPFTKYIGKRARENKIGYRKAVDRIKVLLGMIYIIYAIAGAYFFFNILSWVGKAIAALWLIIVVGALVANGIGNGELEESAKRAIHR